MDLIQRPRRLRGSETLRKMVRETRIDKSSLIYPLFVREGQGIEEEIPSMEGQFRYSVDRLPYELERLTKAGVSNIMLVTVRERTKEIGIKRALGATPGNIISQIMTESVILTLIAGIFGLLLGVGILQIIEILTRDTDFFLKNPQISFSVAVGGLIVILIVGTLAGLIPAKRAIDIKAIEAIRDEN